jgi:hypothetical protein
MYGQPWCIYGVWAACASGLPVHAPRDLYLWSLTTAFYLWVTGALLCLFYQLTVHQDWESDEKRGKKQTFMLCVVPNLIGLGLLYGFMRLKMHGAI